MMRRCAALLCLAVFVFSQAAAGTVSGESDLEIIVGDLTYVPRPDLSTCFCGSYRISTAPQAGDWYLTAELIDLDEYVEARVMVLGRASSQMCDGTLARSCNLIRVEKIVVLTSAGTVSIDWGVLKSIYR